MPTVCFFDSGIGGLNALSACMRRLPNADYIYVADNGNVPYGNLSPQELLSAADGCFETLAKFAPDAAVIACNTVTAQCAEYLRKKYPFPIIGIQPAVKPAAASGGKCVVLATAATAKSESLRRLIKEYGNGVTQTVVCPELASYIERNIFNLNEEGLDAVLPDLTAQSVVLGCTHYIFAKEYIKRKYACSVFDGIDGTVNRICSVLAAKPCGNALQKPALTFVGGDKIKNKKVFDEVLKPPEYRYGEIFPKKSPQIP